jgi:hypothetical protein
MGNPEVLLSIAFHPQSFRTSLVKSAARLAAAGLFGVLFLFGTALSAQTTASLSGTVHDQNGAVIAKAKVELIETKSRAIRDTVSNGQGRFEITAIQPATYDIVVSAPSFETSRVTGIELHPGDSQTIPAISLKVGAAVEEVTITAEAAGVSTDSPEKSVLITADDIQRLSTVSRDVTELIKTLPGFAVATAGNLSNQSTNVAGQTMGFGSSSVTQFAANGSAPQTGGTQVTSDGANVTDPGDMGASIGNVNMDMVQEVKVQTSNFGADSAKGPVIINAIGKSGGSVYHGSAYLFARNSALNSNDWQNNYLGTPRPPTIYYFPGANVGGPVRIPGTDFNHAKKMTFFAGFEYYLQTQASRTALAFVPTARMLGGDLTPASIGAALNVDPSVVTAQCPNDYTSGLLANSGGFCFSPGTTGTPLTTQQDKPISQGQVSTLPCNLDTTSSSFNASGCLPVDPRAAVFAKFWPAPNRVPQATSGLLSDGYNYVKTLLATHNGYQFRGRLDENFTDSLKFYVTYNFEKINDQAPVTNVFYAGTDVIPYPTSSYTNAKSNILSANLTKVLGSSATNEFIVAGVYFYSPDQLANRALVQDANTGWSGGRHYQNNALQLPDIIDYEQGVPDFSMDYFPSSSAFLRKVSYNAADNLTKQIRSHTLKVGVYAENTANNQVLYSTAQGQYAFNHYGYGCTTDDGTKISQLQNNVANFLQGCGSFIQNNSSPSRDMNFKTLDLYGTDEWKATRKLTLTLGIRFDHLGHWLDAHGNGLAVWTPPQKYLSLANTNVTANATSYPGISWHQTDPSVPLSGVATPVFFYAPRVGLAYDLYGNGKTVLRGGWGAYRFHDSYNDSAGPLDTVNGVQTYSSPTNINCTYDQIAGVAPTYYAGAPTTAVGCVSNSSKTSPFTIYALAKGDTRQPVTYNYNFTVDQQFFFKSRLEISYTGNQSHDLFTEGLLANQNYIPLGGLFQPDPQTGAVTVPGSSQQVVADYRPYPYYSAVNVYNHIAYSNYNGMQVSWNKQKGAIIFGANYTWAKALGIRGDYRTGVVGDPSTLRNNYGILGFNRNQAVNFTYSLQSGNRYKGNRFVAKVVNNWEISGITSLQSGPDTVIGNGNTNYGLGGGVTYTPPGGTATSITINNTTLLGTPDISLQPIVTCNPKNGLHNSPTQGRQFFNSACFALPPYGSNGSFNLPDLHGPAYFNTDLTVQRSIKLRGKKELQFRAAGFNFLNHPISTFSLAGVQNGLALSFGSPNNNATTPAQAFSQATLSTQSALQFGYTPYKVGLRIVELGARFNF